MSFAASQRNPRPRGVKTEICNLLRGGRDRGEAFGGGEVAAKIQAHVILVLA